ncbi:hypothetical protein [Mesorhizobium sp. B1-1-8]|uniref:hypothetical protein n=1 Tax=Mesorhizobium sp. B1-1-8 TaxID=2589976 RepID=UPI0015E393AB|nr:hypothetical protein [Mesorhizobium sp. B1-1-8]UCI09269.1 hypothetical protein FJ974_09465 [Mesorhizobium sp. B1-1-8]
MMKTGRLQKKTAGQSNFAATAVPADPVTTRQQFEEAAATVDAKSPMSKMGED